MEEDMEREMFRTQVFKALDGLPPHLRKLLENLAVVVEDLPSRRDLEIAGLKDPMRLLGLYVGVPFTRWGRDRHPHPPDVIKIYRLPVLAALERGEEVEERVRKVVLHELGHRAGLGEKRLRELGIY